MSNSMDTILVRYGLSLDKKDYKLLYPSSLEVLNTFGHINKIMELEKEIKTCTVPEFLALKSEELSAIEQKIQTALRTVYEINGRKPPLYQKFPNYQQNKPLTIDVTTAGKTEAHYDAAYHIDENRIDFEEIDDPEDLVENIAHELKHAEQYNEKVLQLHEELRKNNAYGWQQLSFLIEAQAYATGIFVGEEYAHKTSKKVRLKY